MARKSRARSATGTPPGDQLDSTGRPAAADIPASRAANVKQLRRARGQVEGIERMILDGRSCVDVITQITAARAGLLVVAKALLQEHLLACHHAAVADGNVKADAMYQELVNLVAKMAK